MSFRGSWRKLTDDLRPQSLLALSVSLIFFLVVAVSIDTAFYNPNEPFYSTLLFSPVITPLNNLLYNSSTSNLAQHGLHPRYQHFLVNLFELLGPAYLLLFVPIFTGHWRSFLRNPRVASALSATAILSIFPHQEARFLIPCVPLLLTSIRVPSSRVAIAVWVVFNSIFGVLMGIYHQGGVVPVQLQIPEIVKSMDLGTTQNASVSVYWWKTYSPPTWLLGDLTEVLPATITTHDLMGMPRQELIEVLHAQLPSCEASRKSSSAQLPVLLVAPQSATFLDQYKTGGNSMAQETELRLTELYSYRRHLNLDDLDVGDDGLGPTWGRVVGRRGLGVWSVERPCGGRSL